MHRVFEVNNVERRQTLIEVVTVPARIEPQQRTQEEANRGFMRDDEQLLTRVGADDLE